MRKPRPFLNRISNGFIQSRTFLRELPRKDIHIIDDECNYIPPSNIDIFRHLRPLTYSHVLARPPFPTYQSSITHARYKTANTPSLQYDASKSILKMIVCTSDLFSVPYNDIMNKFNNILFHEFETYKRTNSTPLSCISFIRSW